MPKRPPIIILTKCKVIHVIYLSFNIFLKDRKRPDIRSLIPQRLGIQTGLIPIPAKSCNEQSNFCISLRVFDSRTVQCVHYYKSKKSVYFDFFEFSRWKGFIGDDVLTKALVGKLAGNAVILNMNGEDYRLASRRA